jgi:membrane fusion protein (multidrug efflux system)
MRGKRVRLVVLSLAGLAFAGGLLFFYTSPRAVDRRARVASVETGPSAAPAPTESGVPVVAQTVRVTDERATVEVTGLVDPIRSVVVAAEVEGRVAEVPVEEHSRVEAGDVLIRLDPVFLQVAVQRAEAAVQRAQAARELARLDFERQQGLARGQVASAADLDRARSEERSTYAALLEAKAALEDAQARLERSEVRAPFAAVVHRLDLEPGAYLRTGSEVAELVDLSTVEVGIEVTDRQVVALKVGRPVSVEVPVYAGERFEGTIFAIGRAAQDGTRKYPITVRLPNPGERILPGMVSTVHLRLASSGPSLQIPREAVRREFELEYVFLVEPDEDGSARARRRRVVTRVVPFAPEKLEVVDGLGEGERVVVSGVRGLRDGVRVRVGEDGL